MTLGTKGAVRAAAALLFAFTGSASCAAAAIAPSARASTAAASPPAAAACPEGQTHPRGSASVCCRPGQASAESSGACENACGPGRRHSTDGGCVRIDPELEEKVRACRSASPETCAALGEIDPAELRAHSKSACESGEAEACFLLAWTHRPVLEPRIVELAVATCAAGKLEPCAIHSIEVASAVRELGRGAIDTASALPFLAAACRGGHGAGCYQLAVVVGKDRRAHDEEPVALFARACEKGYLPGCSQYVYRSLTSEIVERDAGTLAAAESSLRRACDEALAQACNNLGVMTQDGLLEGKPRDLSAAVRLYERACEGGSTTGCRNLALAGLARPELGKLGLSYSAALRLLTDSCSPASPEDCHTAGLLHRRGLGTKASASAAKKLFKRACEQGMAEACKMR